MEENLNFCKNGRGPQFFRKGKTTYVFHEMEKSRDGGQHLLIPNNHKLFL
jgi:hypothetical protein